MAYQYDIEKMKAALQQLISKNLDTKSGDWLQQQYKRYMDTHLYRQGNALSQRGDGNALSRQINLTFTAIPRFVNKAILEISDEEKGALQQILPGFEVSGWPVDRLVRSWWLLQLPTADENDYVTWISGLFKAAEMNEQVALYGSLPLFAYPEKFVKRATEGLRTNISSVFEAIALRNPYPAKHFEEAAWNQMVLKAFFMNVNVSRISGMDSRANVNLAHILSDYAHERWAAGRDVNPLLWRPVGPFIDEKIFPDIERLTESDNEQERKAAMLACSRSDYGPAKELLRQSPELTAAIEAGTITWENFR